MKARVGNKQALIIIAVVIAVVIVALVGVAVGHSVYAGRQEAIITDFGVLDVTDDGLIYRYADGLKSIDISDAFSVSSGADYEIVKIKDEDGTVSKGSGKVIDLSSKDHRIAVIKVVSASKKNSSDYSVTFIPQSQSSNVISYSMSGADKSDAFLYTYSGNYDVNLPTPTKTFESTATGIKYSFPFEGWYTTSDYQDGTEITAIPKGSVGEIKLYAKFADSVIAGSREGSQSVVFGRYPQTQVTDYNLSRDLRNSDEYNAVKGNSIGYFDYNGDPYCYFIPTNVPNLAENGYSSGSTYFFKVEPIEWRILKAKNETASNNESVYILSTKVLNCGAYSSNGGMIQDLYKTYVNQNNFELSGFEKRYFDPDTMYYEGIKSDVDAIYNVMSNYLTSAQTSAVNTRTFSHYTNIFSASENYSCYTWLINYSESLNSAYGFSTDYTYNDALRKAYCSDFAAACGVYRSTSVGHLNQGSWWLRGAGDTYTYEHKHVAYVKFTGYVHSYGAMNFAIRSGIRPAMSITYTAANFPDSEI